MGKRIPYPSKNVGRNEWEEQHNLWDQKKIPDQVPGRGDLSPRIYFIGGKQSKKKFTVRRGNETFEN